MKNYCKGEDCINNKEISNIKQIQDNLYMCLPTNIEAEILEGFGGSYCILEMGKWQAYSYTKRKDKSPVFCPIPDDVKLYETQESAINGAKKILNSKPNLQLCVTYYGIAVKTYIKAGICLKEQIKVNGRTLLEIMDD